MTGNDWHYFGMDEEQRKTLGAQVQAARLTAGMSKEAVARKAEVSSITYKRVEDGKSVHDANLSRILNALHLSDVGDVARSVASDTVPVGAGVDADVLADLVDLEPEKVQRVRDFIKGIKAGE